MSFIEVSLRHEYRFNITLSCIISHFSYFSLQTFLEEKSNSNQQKMQNRRLKRNRKKMQTRRRRKIPTRKWNRIKLMDLNKLMQQKNLENQVFALFYDNYN